MPGARPGPRKTTAGQRTNGATAPKNPSPSIMRPTAAVPLRTIITAMMQPVRNGAESGAPLRKKTGMNCWTRANSSGPGPAGKEGTVMKSQAENPAMPAGPSSCLSPELWPALSFRTMVQGITGLPRCIRHIPTPRLCTYIRPSAAPEPDCAAAEKSSAPSSVNMRQRRYPA